MYIHSGVCNCAILQVNAAHTISMYIN
jgi:hypothetical protein